MWTIYCRKRKSHNAMAKWNRRHSRNRWLVRANDKRPVAIFINLNSFPHRYVHPTGRTVLSSTTAIAVTIFTELFVLNSTTNVCQYGLSKSKMHWKKKEVFKIDFKKADVVPPHWKFADIHMSIRTDTCGVVLKLLVSETIGKLYWSADGEFWRYFVVELINLKRKIST